MRMLLDGKQARPTARLDTDAEAFAEIVPALSAAASDASCVSAHPDWLHACVHAFHGEAGTLRHLASIGDGRVLASLPLVRVRRDAAHWLELCGSSALHEPGEIIYESVEALELILREAIAFGDPIELTRVRVDPELHASLRRCARGHGIVVRIDAPRTVHVDLLALGRSVEALVPSSQRRRNLERCRRRLREHGTVDCQWLRPANDEIESVLARALAIEDSGWKGHTGRSMAKRSDLHNFVLGIARSFAGRGALIVAFLTLDGEPVAMQVVLEHGKAWHEVKIGYDERWKSVAPGMLLAVATLLRAAEEGVERYEFMGNEEPRHAAFAHQSQDFDTLVYLPFNLRGTRAIGQIARSRVSRGLAALAGGRAS